jgi:uncharacterized protein YdbL (DUF1318 family)
MTIRLLFVGAAVAAAAVPVVAQVPPQLTAALRTGQVGERYDGYLGYAAPVPPAVQRQVGAINIRRRALYTDLATRRGVQPQDVGLATGCELLARVAVGQTYMLADGKWHRRDPGEAPPRPDYCG